MHVLHSFVLRISKWPVWLFFLMACLFFAGYVMNRAAADMKAVCNPDTQVPDIEIGYTPAELREMLPHLSGACGETFLHIARVTDSFYPLAYGGFFFFSIVFLYYKGKNPIGFRGLYLLAPVCMVFDYLENYTVGYLVSHPTDYAASCLTWASVFSGLKWLFAFMCMGLMLVGIIRWLIWRFRKI